MGYLGEDSFATRQSGDRATESTAVPEGVLYSSHRHSPSWQVTYSVSGRDGLLLLPFLLLPWRLGLEFRLNRQSIPASAIMRSSESPKARNLVEGITIENYA